jgi:hypothetical protein
MGHFPYHDTWESADDEVELYEHHLRRKHARGRWALAALTGTVILLATSGMILLGGGARVASTLDRWETEVWEPTLATTIRRQQPPPPSAAPVIPSPPIAPTEPPPVEPTAAAPSTAPPAPEPSAAPSTAPSAAPAAEPRTGAPAPSQRPAAPQRGAKPPKSAAPDRTRIHSGGVEWHPGAAAPSGQSESGEVYGDAPAPKGSEQAPAPEKTAPADPYKQR